MLVVVGFTKFAVILHVDNIFREASIGRVDPIPIGDLLQKQS